MFRFLQFTACFLVTITANARPVKRNEYKSVQKNPYGDEIFQLGDVSYLANLKSPKIRYGDFSTVASSSNNSGSIPFTVISTNVSLVTGEILQHTIARYLENDDVLTNDFLHGLYISSTLKKATIDSSALSYLQSISVSNLFLGTEFSSLKASISTSFTITSLENRDGVPISPGPYAASISTSIVSFASVYRLYEDTYRTFLFGAYEAGDGKGTYNPFGAFVPNSWDVMIPVPSRIYSWGDTRPLAGERVAIKDLYDIKGLQTSGGSRAWALVNPIANATAPSVQRIIDLGGVIVGKQKLAQFASGANPWDWQDEQYPFNPRGDGWLTCSASSSGGGCSIAAYEWLDYAIGSDTGSSMRRPAAVSGVYGERPSQGLMSLEGVIPLGGATDTAGVFSRNPYKWIKFAKHWYTPGLIQNSSITGLSPLVVPDTTKFPKRILYPVDYLPLNNSAAEPILQGFISSMAELFGMKVQKMNFTASLLNASSPLVRSWTKLSSSTGVISSYSQYEVIFRPLLKAWAEQFDGRFPPIDPARRSFAHSFNETAINAETYAQALKTKNEGVQWYESKFQYSTAESCSESILLYDIGTGGLPSFRERELNDSPAASYLAVSPRNTLMTGAGVCPLFGCVDFTIPIGQVPYKSNVTFHEEMVPVTINIVAKRGCDFMLYNMVEKLADAGVLKTVKTGRTAY